MIAYKCDICEKFYDCGVLQDAAYINPFTGKQHGVAFRKIGVSVDDKVGFYKYDICSDCLAKIRNCVEKIEQEPIYHLHTPTFTSLSDAHKVLCDLFETLEKYKCVFVADLYDMIGITANYTDAKYGWTDFSEVTIKRADNGYSLILPKAINLKEAMNNGGSQNA